MTKFLLGVAVGYMLSDMIDELLGKSTSEKISLREEPPKPENVTDHGMTSSPETPQPPPPSPPMPGAPS